MNRNEYMQNPTTYHEAYYRQFVTKTITACVVRMIRKSRLFNSNDPDHLNDIPLKEWDKVALSLPLSDINTKMQTKGDYPTLAGLVCICKTAARDYIKTNKETK